jgi:hypothetical protein
MVTLTVAQIDMAMTITQSILFVALSTGTLGCSEPRYPMDTPASEYESNQPYKIVYLEDQIFLNYTLGKAPPFGPFSLDPRAGVVRYLYPDSRGGTHSIALIGEDWWYSWSQMKRRGQAVDASELMKR